MNGTAVTGWVCCLPERWELEGQCGGGGRCTMHACCVLGSAVFMGSLTLPT